MQRLLLILLFHELQNFCSVLLLVFSSFKSLFVQAFHLATDANKFKQVTNKMGKTLILNPLWKFFHLIMIIINRCGA